MNKILSFLLVINLHFAFGFIDTTIGKNNNQEEFGCITSLKSFSIGNQVILNSKATSFGNLSIGKVFNFIHLDFQNLLGVVSIKK